MGKSRLIRLVLNSHAPVGVVINSGMEVVQFRGRTSPYLEPPSGRPSLNVLNLALAVELQKLIIAAKKKGAAVKREGVTFEDNGHRRILNLSVSPLGEKHSSTEAGHFLILFEDVTSRTIPDSGNVSQKKGRAGANKNREFKRLKQELADARHVARAAVESEGTLREDFQSANEEVMSANEELKTSREE